MLAAEKAVSVLALVMVFASETTSLRDWGGARDSHEAMEKGSSRYPKVIVREKVALQRRISPRPIQQAMSLPPCNPLTWNVSMLIDSVRNVTELAHQKGKDHDKKRYPVSCSEQ